MLARTRDQAAGDLLGVHLLRDLRAPAQAPPSAAPRIRQQQLFNDPCMQAGRAPLACLQISSALVALGGGARCLSGECQIQGGAKHACAFAHRKGMALTVSRRACRARRTSEASRRRGPQ